MIDKGSRRVVDQNIIRRIVFQALQPAQTGFLSRAAADHRRRHISIRKCFGVKIPVGGGDDHLNDID